MFKQNPHLWKELETVDYRMIFASPEMLLGPNSYFWHKIANNDKHPLIKRLNSIVIDEAHVVWKWGESGFRPEYRNIGSLRVYFPNTPFLLLSATLAPNVLKYLHTTLQMATPTAILKRSIARNNVRLLISKAAGAGYHDLDFLLDQSSIVSLIPKTMIFVDSKAEAQSLAGYLRSRLPPATMQSGVSDDIIRVYTASLDPPTRAEFMRLFKAGDSRILVCTDAAGMGMDIRNINIVIQFKLTEQLSLADLWQRLGRCARDQTIEGLALVFVDDKYCFDAAVSEENLLEQVGDELEDDLSSYVHAVSPGPTSIESTNLFTPKLYRRSTAKAGAAAFFKLDPPLLWMINTHGCRARVLLAAFDDPDTFSSNFNCKCDNCSFPERSEVNRRLPPKVLTVPAKQKFKRGERVALTNQLKLQHADKISARKESIPAFRSRAQDNVYGFSLQRTLRYQDSAAFEQDQIDLQLAMNAEYAAKLHPTAAQVQAVTESLLLLRATVYERHNIARKYGILPELFITSDLIKKIANDCLKLNTLFDLDTVVGTKLSLSNSLLEPILHEILDTTIKARDNAALPTNNLDSSVARTNSAAPEPVNRGSGNRTIQKVVPTAQESDRAGTSEAGSATATHMQTAGAMEVPTAVPAKRRRKYDIPYIPESEFDLSKPEDVKRLNLQRNQQKYDDEIQERKVKRTAEAAQKKAEDAVQKRNQQNAAAKLTKVTGTQKRKNTVKKES
jgi:hypothetical protein